MGKIVVLLFGLFSYLVFFVTFLYAVGFVGNLYVPKSIDSGVHGPLLSSALINLVLLTVFALQHSVMARPGFKEAWTKIIPKSIERSVYVLLSSLALILLFWQWRPMTDLVWNVENSAGRGLLWGLFAMGWLTVLLSTFMINHFDLFGLRQVYHASRGTDPSDLPFQTKWLYKLVRHPIMLGFIIAFWAIPTMSYGHLLFALVTTAYIFVAVQIEERDLVAHHGERYLLYQRQVSMLIPIPKVADSPGVEKPV